MFMATEASAAVVLTEEGSLGRTLNLPVSEWRDPATGLKGIIVLIHGVTLHAGVFDVAARDLASRGFLVVAPDLRGFGRWHKNVQVSARERKVNYALSLKDIIRIIERLRLLNPKAAVFCLGESLGANMAVRLAATRPDLVDGIVLSSPCVFRHISLVADMVPHAVQTLFGPRRQINMKSYIRSRLSEDPKVVEGYSLDPGIRKTLSLPELVQSRSALRRGYLAANRVPPKIPVLILQGTADRLFKPKGVAVLLDRLPAEEEQVQWFQGRGHLLLETAHVRPEVLETVATWLNERLRQPELSARGIPEGEEAGADLPLKRLQ